MSNLPPKFLRFHITQYSGLPSGTTQPLSQNKKQVLLSPFSIQSANKKLSSLQRAFYTTIPRSIDSPWILSKIDCNKSLLKYNKTNNNPDVLKSLFHELKEKHANHSHMYTNNSKTQSGTGYTVVSEDSIIKVKLPQEASIFYCKLKTLKHSIDETANERNKWLRFCHFLRLCKRYLSDSEQEDL